MSYLRPSQDNFAPDFVDVLRAEGLLDRDLSAFPVPESRSVDPFATRGLMDAAQMFAERTVVPNLSDSERLARAGAAGDAARDLRDTVALLDVYGPGKHSRFLDFVALLDPRADVQERDAAAARIQTNRQFETLTRALSWADVSGAKFKPQAVLPSLNPSPAAWLNSAFVTAPEGGPNLFAGRHVSNVWNALPQAFLDPASGDDLGVAASVIFNGSDVPWHTSGLAITMSRPRIDWTLDGGKETENALSAAVDVTLEKAMLADITVGAPVAASFQAAEMAVGGAWTQGADLILCSGADRPKILRAYNAEQLRHEDRPTILATAGATTGTALVIASSGVVAEANDQSWMTADAPKALGKAVAVFRYGMGKVRVPGVVQKVTVA